MQNKIHNRWSSASFIHIWLIKIKRKRQQSKQKQKDNRKTSFEYFVLIKNFYNFLHKML